MGNSFSRTTTPWSSAVVMDQATILTGNIHCDVCVVGGGIAGLTTAYLLTQNGKKVCLLESLNFGDGQTGHTTAHVTAVLDERYMDIADLHGVDSAHKVLDSHQAALRKIEDIVTREKIDCDLEWVDAYLCTSVKAADQDTLQSEIKMLHQLGWQSVTEETASPLKGFTTGPAIRFPRQLQFHPLKYLQELASITVRQGGQIFWQTAVREVSHSSQSTCEVKTATGYSVYAQAVVMATNTPINNTFALHTKQAPYRTYAMAYQVAKDSIPRALYWDTEDPYHYVRTQPFTNTHDLLIVGGEDHKTGQNHHPETCFERLHQWSLAHFPNLEGVVHRWSGQVMEPIDGLPYLGHNPMDKNNVYVITGHSGVGMAQSTIGAMLITDQIMGIKNPWEQVYNPSRFPLGAIKEFIKENANVAAQYTDWVVPQPYEAIEDLARGQGMVVNQGLRKIAVYRSVTGQLKTMSAACPHLGGIVQWNSVEESWDCPCHGSRFNCNGKVIEGPAAVNLEMLDDVIQDNSTADLARVRPTLSSELQ